MAAPAIQTSALWTLVAMYVQVVKTLYYTWVDVCVNTGVQARVPAVVAASSILDASRHDPTRHSGPLHWLCMHVEGSLASARRTVLSAKGKTVPNHE